MTPTTRLIGRALLVGVTTALVNFQASTGSDTRAIVTGALVAGILAASEVLTPLNATVGVAKGTPNG